MGFSKEIREDILVASARHCCVCRRYKGVKVEIHHILPKEQGGEDSFENAIVVCFDCHADAGHYFANHPKGSKFSPDELKKHKEAWFRIVKGGNIPVKRENIIHARYLITKEFDILKQLSMRNLSNFPIPNCLVYENHVLEEFKYIFKNQRYRRLDIEKVLNTTPEKYKTKFPEAAELIPEDDEYQQYYHERSPKIADIEQKGISDGLAQYLLQNGVSPDKIAKILTCYQGECGGSGKFQELILLRPLYIKFLVLTNITKEYMRVNRIDGLEHDALLFREENFEKEFSIALPQILIAPQQSIIIPLGMFLANYDDLDRSESFYRINETGKERTFALDHFTENKDQDIEYLNRNLKPQKVVLEYESEEIAQDLHDFDFHNLYWIDGYWHCGSCPHLFYETVSSKLVYKGEIFNIAPNFSTSFSCVISEGIQAIVIAEIEHETTFIESIFINNIKNISNITLEYGQSLRVSVNQGDILVITGHYTIEADTYRKMPIHQKYKEVSRYKDQYYISQSYSRPPIGS